MAVRSTYGQATIISKNVDCFTKQDGRISVIAGEDDYISELGEPQFKGCGLNSVWSLSLISGYAQLQISTRSGKGGIHDHIFLAQTELSKNTWHNIVVTRNASNVVFYIDGQQDTVYQLKGSILNISDTTYIANKDGEVGNGLFDGLISSLKVWNVALDEAESLLLYNSTSAVKEESLIGRYTWSSEAGYVNAVNDAKCVPSNALTRTLELEKNIQQQCESRSFFDNISALAGVSTTMNIQIDPEIPVPVPEGEPLLERQMLFTDNATFAPIRLVATDDAIYVTSLGTGIWKFSWNHDENSDEITIDDPVLVVRDKLCELINSARTPNQTYTHIGSQICVSKDENITKFTVRESITPVYVMATIEQRETLPHFGSQWEFDGGPIMPFDLCELSNGSILISDISAHMIWLFDPESGKTEPFAGTGIPGLQNGNALDAQFVSPTGLVITEGDIVYVADTWNHQIRKIENGVVSTLAGNERAAAGYADGPTGRQILFNAPLGLSLSEDRQSLYVADTHNHVIRTVSISDGETATLAGHGTGFVDGIGPLSAFGSPVDLAPIPWQSGAVFVTDTENTALRKIIVRWSNVETPIQMTADEDYSSPRTDSSLSRACSFGDSQFDCIEELEVLPSYGIEAFKNIIIVADTSAGSVYALKRSGLTLSEKLESCRREAQKKAETKIVIAGVCSAIILVFLLTIGAYAVLRTYKQKKARLDEKELHLKRFVQKSIYEDASDSFRDQIKYQVAHSLSPLDQALEFLKEIADGKTPSQDEASKVRKHLIYGALVNADVSKPLDFDKGLSEIQKHDEGILVADLIQAPKRFKTRSKKRWHKTFTAYHVAHLLRDNSNQHPSPAQMLATSPGLLRTSRIEDLMRGSKFQIDLFELDNLSDNHALSSLAEFLFQDYGLLGSLAEPEAFSRFTRRIEELMKDVPYHNRMHVAGVLHAMDFLLMEGGLMSFVSDQYELMGCLLAAIVHDFQHPGINNDFLVRTSHELALTYNDRSPLESFHLSSSFYLLKNAEMDFMQEASEEDKRHVREMIIDLVMATDMSKHFEILSQGKLLLTAREPRAGIKVANENFLRRQSQGSQGRAGVQFEEEIRLGDVERALILRIAMKCADFNHAFQDFECHEKWSSRVVEEFCQQGDKELLEGYEPTGMFDRKSLSEMSIAKSQAAFLDIVVIPLFELLAELLPATSPMLDQVRLNSSLWKSSYSSSSGRSVSRTFSRSPTFGNSKSS